MASSDVLGKTKVKMLVTDDSPLYRRMIADILRTMDEVELIGTAFDGEDCLNILEREKPHLVTLDLQMPRRDGMSTLQEIRRRQLETDVVMVCSPTQESANQTVEALESGALDFILKPSFNTVEENAKSLESQLKSHIDSVRARIAGKAPSSISTRPSSPSSRNTPFKGSAPKVESIIRSTSRPIGIECICIGVSTGGPNALNVLLGALPANVSVPILIVQHMPALFTKSLADHLNHAANLTVSEAVNGETALPGHAYIAPGGKQMKIEKGPGGIQIIVNDDPPVGACKPSVDYLFHSVREQCGGKVIAAILTGMGNDGLSGCRELSQVKAHIIAQDAASCVVYGMPRQIIENNLANDILPLTEIANRIIQLLPPQGTSWR